MLPSQARKDVKIQKFLKIYFARSMCIKVAFKCTNSNTVYSRVSKSGGKLVSLRAIVSKVAKGRGGGRF